MVTPHSTPALHGTSAPHGTPAPHGTSSPHGTGAGGAAQPVLAGIGVAHPPPMRQDELWDDFFAEHYGGVQRALAKRVFANAGVVTRHGVINPVLEDVSRWSTQARMERYLTEALPLGKVAISAALDATGMAPEEIGMFVVCSCTGYVTPGLDILLARDFGMAPETQRLFIGHMGCYAALPGLGAVSDYVSARGRPALLLCLELTSLHVQPSTNDPQQIVAHALFSDAAAAAVVAPADTYGGGGYRVREVASLTVPAAIDHMTWDVTDLGFRMGLKPEIPDVLAQHVSGFVLDLLGRHGLELVDVDAWGVHPGGPRILNVVERELGLAPDALAASRRVLAEHGNCSSPTTLMIMDLLRQVRPAAKHLLAMAFGPGLTLYAVLLRAVG
jgi:alkylresorcinol/alkylpyrone synthase